MWRDAAAKSICYGGGILFRLMKHFITNNWSETDYLNSTSHDASRYVNYVRRRRHTTQSVFVAELGAYRWGYLLPVAVFGPGCRGRWLHWRTCSRIWGSCSSWEGRGSSSSLCRPEERRSRRTLQQERRALCALSVRSDRTAFLPSKLDFISARWNQPALLWNYFKVKNAFIIHQRRLLAWIVKTGALHHKAADACRVLAGFHQVLTS